MTFDSCIISDVHVLTPRTNLAGGDETEALKTAIAELVVRGVPRVVVDLGKISWVSSLGLSGLIRAKKSCTDHHGGFGLARVGQRIDSVLLTTRLGLLFDTFETVDDAVAAQVHESQSS